MKVELLEVGFEELRDWTRGKRVLDFLHEEGVEVSGGGARGTVEIPQGKDVLLPLTLLALAIMVLLVNEEGS